MDTVQDLLLSHPLIVYATLISLQIVTIVVFLCTINRAKRAAVMVAQQRTDAVEAGLVRRLEKLDEEVDVRIRRHSDAHLRKGERYGSLYRIISVFVQTVQNKVFRAYESHLGGLTAVRESRENDDQKSQLLTSLVEEIGQGARDVEEFYGSVKALCEAVRLDAGPEVSAALREVEICMATATNKARDVFTSSKQLIPRYLVNPALAKRRIRELIRDQVTDEAMALSIERLHGAMRHELAVSSDKQA